MRIWKRVVVVAALCALAWPACAEGAKKIVFLAGPPTHGPGEHESIASIKLLQAKLEEAMPDVETVYGGPRWPGEEIFEGAASIVLYCDGGGGHFLNPRLDFIDGLMKKGVGLVLIHYAVEPTPGEREAKFIEWIGGAFEPHWSVNPHWEADYTEFPKHAINNGVAPFKIDDEWYFHMRFAEGMKGVTPILSCVPPKSTMEREDGPHSGNPDVRAAVEKGEPQHMAWAYERTDGGRGFGFTGLHYHKSLQNDSVRKVLLNAIAWSAKIEVPEKGIETKTPTDEEIAANQKPKK